MSLLICFPFGVKLARAALVGLRKIGVYADMGRTIAEVQADIKPGLYLEAEADAGIGQDDGKKRWAEIRTDGAEAAP